MSRWPADIVHRPIDETPFIVFDTETTGTDPKTDRLIEIGAVKMIGGEIVDEFVQQINPGRSVPRRITRLTGLTTAALLDQPRAEEVLPTFLEFIGDGVLVAHHIHFDRGFLQASLQRANLSFPNTPTVCTLRLARRLLPQLLSKRLDAVAKHYQITISNRHRALGDATATAAILTQLLDALHLQQPLENLEDLLRFQHAKYNRVRAEPKHLARLREEIFPLLPERPGVYFMKNRRGELIYVGKAKSLRDRVRSYFSGLEAHQTRTRKLMQAVRDITWEETGSELGALLLESKWIKQALPRFNRASRRYRRLPFLRLDTTQAFPTLSWQYRIGHDGAEYFGPLRHRADAEAVVELVNRFYQLRECDPVTFQRHAKCLYADLDRCAYTPCIHPETAPDYQTEVAQVRDFLMGRDRTILEHIEAAMYEASAEQAFEEARWYRDQLTMLARLLDGQACIAAPISAYNAIILQPDHQPDCVQLFYIRFGRLVETLVLPRRTKKKDRATLQKTLKKQFVTTQGSPEEYRREEVDEVRILAHWCYVNRDTLTQIHWSPDQSVEAMTDDIVARLQDI